MMIASFIFFLLGFVAIGVLSVLHHRKTSADYLLAGRNVKPWLVALSAVATNNSGYMFVGLIGFTYSFGLQAVWTMIGWILGDFLISFLVHKRLRVKTEDSKSLSFAGVISRWHGEEQRLLRAAGGLLTLVFLSTYAAAQLNAGSKALHVLFEWDYALGAILGAGIVLAYCFAGGLRASIWTDAAQSFVMILAMGLMCVMAVMASGGAGDFISNLDAVDPHYLDLFPQDLRFGAIPFMLGWLFAGFGIIGQPHIMVRFMAMDEAQNMGRVRFYYYSWYTVFYALALLCGLASRLLIPGAESFDAELALPSMATELLPPALVGLVLAGLFAATMSTADSQILSCTAAVTRDFVPNKLSGYWQTKTATVLITLFALAVALYGPDSVFTLVLIAWSALACSFGPLLIVYALGGKPGEMLALLMMAGGVATMLAWRHFGLSDAAYEVFPGMMAGLGVYGLGALAARLAPKAKSA